MGIGETKKIAAEYYIHQGRETVQVAQENRTLASKIDTTPDHLLTDDELIAYMQKPKVDILPNPQKGNVDRSAILNEYKTFLAGKIPQSVSAYHSYDQTVAALKNYAKTYPDLCKLVSIGKTYEGRDIYALCVSSGTKGDTSKKPGVVINGLHHAREWATNEVVLKTADVLLTGYAKDPKMKERVNKGEIWLVPLVNPDGYVYSQTKSSMWRKNRRPVTTTSCDEKSGVCRTDVKAIGVDPNRNYYDGDPAHLWLYRPDGSRPDVPKDTPCSTDDDFSSTSDDPQDDTYRGLDSMREAEVTAMMKLEWQEHHNMVGVLDFHSAAGQVLTPMSEVYDNISEKAAYDALGQKMAAAAGDSYQVLRSADLYPCSGASQDFQYLHGLFTYTVELAGSFQPSGSALKQNIEDGKNMSLVFIDDRLGVKTKPNV